MSLETIIAPAPHTRAITFEPAGPVMRTVTVTILLFFAATVLLLVGTLLALALGGILAGLAVSTAREAVHQTTRHHRAPRRG